MWLIFYWYLKLRGTMAGSSIYFSSSMTVTAEIIGLPSYLMAWFYPKQHILSRINLKDLTRSPPCNLQVGGRTKRGRLCIEAPVWSSGLLTPGWKLLLFGSYFPMGPNDIFFSFNQSKCTLHNISILSQLALSAHLLYRGPREKAGRDMIYLRPWKIIISVYSILILQLFCLVLYLCLLGNPHCIFHWQTQIHFTRVAKSWERAAKFSDNLACFYAIIPLFFKMKMDGERDILIII